MSVESERSPSANPQRDFASLQGCFVEGSPEQRARERRIRRRALIISVASQAAILTAIILVPLFGKPEHIAFAMVPVPPYYHNSAPVRSDTRRAEIGHQRNTPCPTCYNLNAPNSPVPTKSDNDPGENAPPDFQGLGVSSDRGMNVGLFGVDNRPQPARPVDAKPQTPQRVFRGHVEPAMLIHRVEPSYPALAKQTHVEGRVELRAIIATDGTIQSLQVISGHPLLLQSAKEAVLQWRYKPTILNGQPVEVDTYITVIYNLER